MILEVVAFRVLAIYFGNTIFTESSVISVILLALSAGYFAGGRLADKKATEPLFYTIILLSGCAVWVIYLFNILLVPFISYGLSLREGPLIISLLLFFVPNFLLGLLSPLVVILQGKRKKAGVGRITGDVFFWSTLGSIAGSLGCGFFLIPFFGTDIIIAGVGVLLILIAVSGFISINSKYYFKLLLLTLILIPLLFTILISIPDLMYKTAHMYIKDGVYSKIRIYDGSFNGKPTRFLRQNLDHSSAEYLNSDELVYNYTKYYSLYKLVNPRIENALVIGGGAYSVPKALLQDDININVDVVDIEPILPDIVKKFFDVPDDPRLISYASDARRYLHDTDKKYDLVFSDAFSFTIPSQLTTREFFQMSKNKLKTNGLFVMNIIGTLADISPSFTLSEIRTFQSVFPNSYFFAVSSNDFKLTQVLTPKGKYFEQNIMIVGYNSDRKLNLLKAVNSSDPFLRSLPEHLIDLRRYDLEKNTLFTDNYAPVEYYMSKTL